MGDLRIKKGASTSPDAATAARELFEQVYDPDAALVIVYCAPGYDVEALGAALYGHFGDQNVVGCTTAGEITPIGYLQGSITAVSIGGPGFHAASGRLDALDDFNFERGGEMAKAVLNAVTKKSGKVPTSQNAFGFLLVDGLSMQEESVVSSIYRQLGDVQLFGGSAGDGTRFEATFLLHEGKFRTNCAVFTVVTTENPFKVFKTEHFVSDSTKMVVTEADPSRRLVTEINGDPAGREYARVVGLEVDKLTPMIFSAHPVVVKVGGRTYVRSIQKVNEDESLTFFCAIEKGIVLTVARGVDLLENLTEAFAAVREEVGDVQLILGCDCILRNLEAQQRDLIEAVGEVMSANNVVGFATYGEQFNAMHVNQTFTGVAIGATRK